MQASSHRRAERSALRSDDTRAARESQREPAPERRAARLGRDHGPDDDARLAGLPAHARSAHARADRPRRVRAGAAPRATGRTARRPPRSPARRRGRACGDGRGRARARARCGERRSECLAAVPARALPRHGAVVRAAVLQPAARRRGASHRAAAHRSAERGHVADGERPRRGRQRPRTAHLEPGPLPRLRRSRRMRGGADAGLPARPSAARTSDRTRALPRCATRSAASA